MTSPVTLSSTLSAALTPKSLRACRGPGGLRSTPPGGRSQLTPGGCGGGESGHRAPPKFEVCCGLRALLAPLSPTNFWAHRG
jgi:hypothetical protein